MRQDRDAKKRIDDHLTAKGHVPREVAREAELLFRAIARSEKLFKPKPKNLGNQRKPSAPWCDYKFGLIPQRIDAGSPRSELAHYQPRLKLGGKEMPAYYSLLRLNNIDAVLKRQIRLGNNIEGLAKSGCNVICVSELGYPFFKFPIDGTESKIDRKNAAQYDSEFRDKICMICNEYNCVVVVGSYHDPDDMTNKAVIFAPNGNFVEHKKLTAAKSDSIGEIIRTPDNSNFLTYDTIVGRVGVLICRDAFDLNPFCRYAMMGGINSNERCPDLILVPSFSKAPLDEACKDLSYFAKTTVVYVNGGGEPHCGIFVGGEQVGVSNDMEDFVFSLTAVDREERIERADACRRKGIFSLITGIRA